MVLKGHARLVAIDLKLTANVNSTFGPYSWGNPAYIDMIQGDTYMYLIRNADVDFNKRFNPEFEDTIGYDKVFTKDIVTLINDDYLAFLYWIFGYKVKMEVLHENNKMIHRLYEDPQGNGGISRQRENLLRYKSVYNEIMYAKSNGYPAMVNSDICSKCECRASKQGDCKLYDGIETS
jgi:hypothetical protein